MEWGWPFMKDTPNAGRNIQHVILKGPKQTNISSSKKCKFNCVTFIVTGFPHKITLVEKVSELKRSMVSTNPGCQSACPSLDLLQTI